MIHLESIKNETRHAAQLAVEQIKRVPVAPVQRGLLVLTTACAVLSLIPPCRLAGSLALRSVALLSSGVNCAEVLQKEDKLSLVTQSSKVALVALGLVGVIAASPVVICASIIANLGLNLFEMGRAMVEGKTERALCQLGAVLIDTFAVGALVTGSWGLMVTAAAVSTVVMLALTGKAFTDFEMVCYPILALTCFATIFSVAPRPASYINRPTNLHHYHPAKGPVYYTPKFAEFQKVLVPYQPALAASEFPKLPIGGTSVVTKDLR